jgi:hypothetical protein
VLRALRIPALSGGLEASFQEMLDQPGAGGRRQRGPDRGEPAAGLAGVPARSP